MMSQLHKHLQNKAMQYLGNKGYWVRSTEAPTPVGIIDAWGMKSMEYTTMAIEVKVSRGDYLSRSQKYKEFSAENIANYCYLLCPEGIIKEHESPNWGILWYSEKTGRLRLIKNPTRFEMTDRQKLAIMLHCLYSGVNNPDKRLVIEAEYDNHKHNPTTESSNEFCICGFCPNPFKPTMCKKECNCHCHHLEKGQILCCKKGWSCSHCKQEQSKDWEELFKKWWYSEERTYEQAVYFIKDLLNKERQRFLEEIREIKERHDAPDDHNDDSILWFELDCFIKEKLKG